MKLERIVRAKCEYPFREHLIEQCAEYTLENALIKNNDNSQHTHTHTHITERSEWMAKNDE